MGSASSCPEPPDCPSVDCPDGQVHDVEACRAENVVSYDCPAGMLHDGENCVQACPTGTRYADGACISDCDYGAGEIWDGSTCATDDSCPAGQYRDDAGVCRSAQGLCPEGRTFANGECALLADLAAARGDDASSGLPDGLSHQHMLDAFKCARAAASAARANRRFSSASATPRATPRTTAGSRSASRCAPPTRCWRMARKSKFAHGDDPSVGMAANDTPHWLRLCSSKPAPPFATVSADGSKLQHVGIDGTQRETAVRLDGDGGVTFPDAPDYPDIKLRMDEASRRLVFDSHDTTDRKLGMTVAAATMHCDSMQAQHLKDKKYPACYGVARWPSARRASTPTRLSSTASAGASTSTTSTAAPRTSAWACRPKCGARGRGRRRRRCPRHGAHARDLRRGAEGGGEDRAPVRRGQELCGQRRAAERRRGDREVREPPPRHGSPERLRRAGGGDGAFEEVIYRRTKAAC